MPIPEPNIKDKLSANMVREILRAIRSLTPIAGHGMRISRGPNGTVYNAKAVKAKKDAAKPDLGRYKIESITVHDSDDEGDQKTLDITLDNAFYRCGGKTYEGSAKSLEDVELPAVIALKVDITGSLPSDELESYASLSELQSEELDGDYYIVPLYEFDATGSLVCDFRIGPDASMFEFSNPTGG